MEDSGCWNCDAVGWGRYPLNPIAKAMPMRLLIGTERSRHSLGCIGEKGACPHCRLTIGSWHPRCRQHQSYGLGVSPFRRMASNRSILMNRDDPVSPYVIGTMFGVNHSILS